MAVYKIGNTLNKQHKNQPFFPLTKNRKTKKNSLNQLTVLIKFFKQIPLDLHRSRHLFYFYYCCYYLYYYHYTHKKQPKLHTSTQEELK